jgi:hypothetical protein
MVILANPTRINAGSRPVVGKQISEKINGASTAPEHRHKENTMHKVARQFIVILDWISGPAMTQQERHAHKIAEAGHFGSRILG